MQTSDTLDRLISQGFSKTILTRFWSKVNKDGPIPEHCPELGPCWIWTGYLAKKGYGSISSGRSQGEHPFKPINVHRVSWLIHYAEIPEGLSVLHHCDNPPCVRPDHLFLGTPHENTQDMMRKGRHIRAMAKLTDEMALEILSIGRTIPASILAQRYNVIPRTIRNLLNEKTYGHINRETPAISPTPQ
jgi:hypothetical protein